MLCAWLISLFPYVSAAQNESAVSEANLSVAILGDSNTWLGGDDCQKPKGWNTWFRKSLSPAYCRSYARSGATWTHTPRTQRDTLENTGRISDDNVIFNQVLRLSNAVKAGIQPTPQLILIAAGTNDAWFPKDRPSVFSVTVENAFAEPSDILLSRSPGALLSLAECVRYNVELLRQMFPQSQVILLSPLQSVQAGEERITRAGDVIEACGKLLDAPVIRQDHECCVKRKNEARKKTYTYDGTHTNEAGARHNGEYIAKRVAALLK